MNYRQIEAFRAVMETGTVVGASNLLNISQPSVSVHIANLEHILKVQLFVRRSGRLVPTAEAMLLNGQADQVVRGMARLKRLAGDIQQLEAGKVTVGVYPALSSFVVPRFIGDFARRHPKAYLALLPEASVTIAQMAAARQIDVGLTAMPVIDPATTCDLIFKTASVCVLPLTHPLADREVIQAADIEGETFIALGREDGSRQAVDRSLDEAGVSVSVRFETYFADSACALVVNGLGISIVDRFAAERWRGAIAIKEFEPGVPCYVYMIRNRARVPSLLQERLEQDFRLFLEDFFGGGR